MTDRSHASSSTDFPTRDTWPPFIFEALLLKKGEAVADEVMVAVVEELVAEAVAERVHRRMRKRSGQKSRSRPRTKATVDDDAHRRRRSRSSGKRGHRRESRNHEDVHGPVTGEREAAVDELLPRSRAGASGGGGARPPRSHPPSALLAPKVDSEPERNRPDERVPSGHQQHHPVSKNWQQEREETPESYQETGAEVHGPVTEEGEAAVDELPLSLAGASGGGGARLPRSQPISAQQQQQQQQQPTLLSEKPRSNGASSSSSSSRRSAQQRQLAVPDASKEPSTQCASTVDSEPERTALDEHGPTGRQQPVSINKLEREFAKNWSHVLEETDQTEHKGTGADQVDKSFEGFDW
jgi:hypothetical protein